MFLVSLSILSLKSQSNPPLRVEIEVEKDSYPVQVFPAQDQGLLLLREKYEPSKFLKMLQFSRYDTNLVKQSTESITVSMDYEYKVHAFYENYWYGIFQNRTSKKIPSKTLVVRYDFDNRSVVSKELDNLGDYAVFALKVFKTKLLLAATQVSNREELFVLDFETWQLDKTVLDFPSDIFLECVDFDKVNQNIRIVLRASDKKKSQMKLLTFSQDMELLNVFEYPDTFNLTFYTAKIAYTDTNMMIITGTYFNDNPKKGTDLHSGTYHLKIRNGETEQLKIKPFGQLSFSNTPQQRTSGDDFRMLLGDIVQADSNYVFLADVYYPEYTQSPAPTSSFDMYYGRFYNTIPVEQFNGFRYVNAYILGFDFDGNLKWSVYYPYNLITKSLKPRIQVHLDGEEAVLFHVYASRLNYMVVKDKQIVEQNKSVQIESLYSSDEIQYNKEVEFQHWYGNNFLYSGYQYIKNNGKINKGKRYVFCMNKIAYM